MDKLSAAASPSVFMSSDGFIGNLAKGGFGNGGQGGGGLSLNVDQSRNASAWLQKMTVDHKIAQSDDVGATFSHTGDAGSGNGGGMDFDAGTSINASFYHYTTQVTNNQAVGGIGGVAISGDGGKGATPIRRDS